MILPNNGWSNPRSYIRKSEENGLIFYDGLYVHNDAEFRFHLNQQETGHHLFRGRISPISPVDGHILQVAGGEKNERLKKLEASTASSESPSEQSTGTSSSPQKPHRIKQLNITSEIYCQSFDEATIKKRIEAAALRLYSKHAALIHRRMKQSTTPGTIIPAVAALLHAEDFLSKNHPRVSLKTRASYKRQIEKHYANMPNIPMAEFKAKDISAYLAETDIGKNASKLLEDFWKYCLNKGICIGSLPFTEPQRRNRKPRSPFPEELDLNMQDKLFYNLMSHIDGSACGTALLVWGGFPATVCCRFTWDDVIFDPVLEDFVRIRFHQDDKAGSTHDFTRPVFPQAALILNARYKALSEQYSSNQLGKMPVVCLKTDPTKAMKSDSLIQQGTLALRSIGVSEEAFFALKQAKSAVSSRIFRNTYIKNLTMRCGLKDDPGTVAFMLGESLSGRKTDDNYTSFVNHDAAERIYTALKAIAPIEYLPQPDTPIFTETGHEKHFIAPEHTRQLVGLVADITLHPGEEIEIFCEHGISGSVRAKYLTNQSDS